MQGAEAAASAPSRRIRIGRRARPSGAEEPTNPLPFSRGNTPERVEQLAQPARRAGEGPRRIRRPASRPTRSPSRRPRDHAAAGVAVGAAAAVAEPPPPQNGASGRVGRRAASLGDALRNLQRYVQRDQFDNPQGGGGQFGPAIQFDTKGVEFGPWIRRFIAQVKRNWLIPYAAMSMKGHVVITFNVHKDGSITDLTVVGPCPIDAFNNAAFGALARRIRRSRCRRNIRPTRRSSPSRSSTTKTPPQ